MNLLEGREPMSLDEAQPVYENTQKDADIWPDLVKELKIHCPLDFNHVLVACLDLRG